MKKIIAVMVCRDCGRWADVPYMRLEPDSYDKSRFNPAWHCWSCKKDCRLADAQAFALEATDARLFDLWLAAQEVRHIGKFSGYRYVRANVRPVLEPML